MPKSKHSHHKAPTARPLRVGEEIRHALADILMRGECYEPGLHDIPITISEVRVSPDLKNATAFFMPLGGKQKEEALEAMVRASPALRTLVAKRLKHLRYMPRLHFKLDITFDEASRINDLLKKPEVARDLKSETRNQKPETGNE